VQLPGSPVTGDQFDLPLGQTAEQYYDQLPITPSVPLHGSSADGQSKPWEKQEVSKEAPGISPQRQEILRSQVARDMLTAKERGLLPGEWSDWIDGILQPKLPWRTLLRQKARQAVSWASGQTDYSYARPSRRQIEGFVFPCLRGPQLTSCVVLDTSGSMSNDDLREALGEIDGIIQQTTGTCTGILCDAEVQLVKKITKASDLAEIKGRGGTSMTVGIEAAVNLKPRPDFCIVCTDGYSDWGEEPAPFPVIVCLIGKGAADKDTVPDWIQTVEVYD
jgi:predicted metal-dependent peptidase